MARHPSLKMKSTDLQKRNVLKRFERVLQAMKESTDEKVDIFRLPKFKRVRLKGVKKEVKKEETEQSETETGADEKTQG